MASRAIRRVYHLAEHCNPASIERDGLLSASRLLDRSGVRDEERVRLERRQRRRRTVLPDGAVIRDQLPMPPAALARCLADGSRPEDWYALVNSMVFFWVDAARLARQARACAPWPQLVLELDAERLLDRHGERARVTPFNTGNALRRPARRGAATFVALRDWQQQGWRAEAAALGVPLRSAAHPPAELAVRDAVPDVMDSLLSVRRFEG